MAGAKLDPGILVQPGDMTLEAISGGVRNPITAKVHAPFRVLTKCTAALLDDQRRLRRETSIPVGRQVSAKSVLDAERQISLYSHDRQFVRQ